MGDGDFGGDGLVNLSEIVSAVLSARSANVATPSESVTIGIP